MKGMNIQSYSLIFNHTLIKTVIIIKIIKNSMHRQDAIHLDQLCPKISNKNWRESLHKLTKYKYSSDINSTIEAPMITPGNQKIKICQAT